MLLEKPGGGKVHVCVIKRARLLPSKYLSKKTFQQTVIHIISIFPSIWNGIWLWLLAFHILCFTTRHFLIFPDSPLLFCCFFFNSISIFSFLCCCISLSLVASAAVFLPLHGTARLGLTRRQALVSISIFHWGWYPLSVGRILSWSS